MQPSLPKNDRLFVALLPDAGALLQIEALAQKLRIENDLRGKLLASDRLHVTLLHLNDYAGLPADVVERAKIICAEIAAGMPSFDVVFDHVKSFPGRDRNPLVMGERGHHAALHGFQLRLKKAFEGIALADKRKYTPHVTLLYDEQRLGARFVNPVQWRVKEFVLVHSLVGKSIHLHLGKWTLGG